MQEIFNNLTNIDTKTSLEGLNNFRIALKNLFSSNNNFGMNDSEAKSFIERILNVEATKESIANAKQEVSKVITDYLTGINQSYKEASKTGRDLNSRQIATKKKYDEASGRSDAIKAAEAKYRAEIERISKENEKLKTRLEEVEKNLKALQEERKARNSQNNSPMGNFRDKLNLEAKKDLSDVEKAAGKYNAQLERVKNNEKAIGNIQSFVQRWFSVYAAARLVSNAFRTMKNDLKDLDDIMTQISIVTDKTQGDLWKQMPQYADMAKQYASSLKGVYEVSQLYYQQGTSNI